MSFYIKLLIILIFSAFLYDADAETGKCHGNAAPPDPNNLVALAQYYFQPMPDTHQWLAEKNITPEQIELGNLLFHEPRLSANGKISCASCHNLNTYGVDNLPQSPGWQGKRGARNSPTVLNASLLYSQFWDGRAQDVEEQAGAPLLNPIEMGLPNNAAAERIVRSIQGYRPLFERAFAQKDGQESITFENITRAIGAFERSLLTPTRFDQYLRGNQNALSETEKIGLRTFIQTNCVMCHNGRGIGGGQFRLFGFERGPYWHYTKSKHIDLGRFNTMPNADTLYVFRVPGLRNIARTAPYFHDGSVKSLPEAIKIMAQVQLDKRLSQQEINQIEAFLKALDGALPPQAKQPPILPQ